MPQSLKFHSVQFIVFYERNTKIREQVFDYENALKIFFKNPFRVISVPNEEDPNIPRFEAVEGKDQIQVNQVRLTFTSFFDGISDIELVRKAIGSRINALRPIILKEKVQFIAFIIEMREYFQNKEEIFTLFKEHTQAKATKLSNLLEYSQFYAIPFQKNYYLNVSCAKIDEKIVELKLGQAPKHKEDKSGINVVLDLNTKFRLINKQAFYEGLINEVEGTIFELIMKNKLNNYLSGELV
jgi:hypothetical protein